MDFYDTNADVYDAVSHRLWDRVLAPVLSQALAPLSASTGTVVDVGAGTGLSTVVLARAAPRCRVVAVEPSRSLRVGLMARVTDSDDLRERTTVLAEDLAGAAQHLPPQLSGLLIANALGHLDPAQRAGLWHLLAQRLEPGGVAAVVLQNPTAAVTVPEQQFGAEVVGDLTYAVSGRAEPSGDDQVTWHLTWRVSQGERVVDERSAATTWWVLSPQDLAGETQDAGLACEEVDADLSTYAITRPPG